ncbi:MAG: site-specific DNA-methyltransferase [Bacilli bacterium]|nr:site-specific DNA-methyltransferase [Bacilli bacterium]
MLDETINKSKEDLISEIEKRVEDKIIEKSNADLLIKLINNSDSLSEAISIAQLGTTYKRTGFHFDKRLEKMDNTIKYFKKNNKLSFKNDESKLTHKLIIGDNYDALLNLLVEYRNKIDVIYIDPPYGKDSMGEFAETNYNNAITRDNLLSMLYPRLELAKQLLNKETGVIICSIDDRNQSYVKCMFDEIFGEIGFLFVAPRITKKGGKSTTTIQKNHDYVLAYAMPGNEIIFSMDEMDDSGYNLEDEYVDKRGKYKLSQCLDYDSLSYSKSLDYPIDYNGQTIYPGGDYEKYKERQSGKYKKADWAWRWSKDKYEFGLKNGFIVVKNGNNGKPRIYTKTYLNCSLEKDNTGKIYIKYTDKAGKYYTTLSFMDNDCSNDYGKKELDKIFKNSNDLFKNPKPINLISKLIKMSCLKDDAIVLDFFAGSGTTGQSVMELNREDGGNRKFILCTNNEITNMNPNGIAYDVTTKRLKRIMSGKCYDGNKEFDWINNNEPYGDNLDVYEIAKVANFESAENKTPFDVIDETLYGLNKFNSIKDKIEWVCNNFEHTQKNIESDNAWKERLENE